MKRWSSFLMVLLLVITSLALFGCDGDDGNDGAPGAPGPAGPSAAQVYDLNTQTPEEPLDVVITSVDVNSPPTINFTITGPNGLPAVGLFTAVGSLGDIRFMMAGLTPGDNAAGVPSEWTRYLYDRVSDEGAVYVDNGDGTYSVTVDTDIADVPEYDPSLVTRMAMQLRNLGPTVNPWLDWIPAGGDVIPGVQNRDIVTIDACNSCHNLLAFHGRGRVETTMCVTCHNTPTEPGYEMTEMIHQIHAASETYDGGAFAEVTYPQDLRNCTTCHQGADTDAWLTLQNADVCTQCHAAEDIAPHAITENTPACSACHPSIAPELDVELLHQTVNQTVHNPGTPAGLVNFTYDLISASVDDANVATINFQILADGVPLTALPPVTEFTGDPDLLFAYASAQDGIDEPADFNNLGNENSANQPDSVGLSTLGENLTNADGVFTATVADAFPDGATLRTVGLQAYFTQVDPAEARHTVSDVIGVAGDEVRREVVDSAKCSACHEFFEGHGGNRVFSFDGGVQICTLCHVPNLASSGRTYTLPDPVTNSNTLATIAMFGDDPLAWPEDTNNFKDLIHGIHAATDRPYEFVRIRSGNAYPFDWEEVTFPGILSDCSACHKGDTFVLDELPSGLLSSAAIVDGANVPPLAQADVIAARASQPNANDYVNSPISSACFYCHDSAPAESHMELNGGFIMELRSIVTNPAVPAESCIVCHGEGAIADVAEAHNQ